MKCRRRHGLPTVATGYCSGFAIAKLGKGAVFLAGLSFMTFQVWPVAAWQCHCFIMAAGWVF
jgi:hypothetical protein